MSRTIDLITEYLEAIDAAVEPRLRARLDELGLRAASNRIGFVGLSRISPGDGLYAPDPDGPMATIFPVYDGPIDDAMAYLSAPERLVDLVAWQPKIPDTMLTRCGIATALGGDAIAAALFAGAPLRLFRNPGSWARADGAGAVVLDWKNDLGLLAVKTLVAEDVHHGGFVKARLKELRKRQLRDVPAIRVPEKAEAAH